MTHTPLREIFQRESTTGDSRSRLGWDISFCQVGGHLLSPPPSEPSPQLSSLLPLLSSRANHTTREEGARTGKGQGREGADREGTRREIRKRTARLRAGSRDSLGEGCRSVYSDGAVTSDLVPTELTWSRLIARLI